MTEANTGTDRGELLTLSEVSNRTGISMPTLQRYKKNYQNRLPTVGKGRKQRYPEEALPIFEEIKKENIAKRGRPPKKASEGKRTRKGGRGSKAKTTRSPDTEGLLTLTEVAERTGISYPTLVRYVKLHRERIPFEGRGRQKRYHPEAVEIFQQIRSESPRGRRKGGAKKSGGRAAGSPATDGSVARRLQSLERSQERLTQELRELVKHLKKPMRATFERK